MQPKALMVFIGTFLLLGISESVLIECPVCGGKGSIDVGKMFGMESVRIVLVKSQESEIETCEEVLGYVIWANISMVNEGSGVARGYILATLQDPITGEALDQRLLPVHLAAGTRGYISMRQIVMTRAKQVDVSAGLPSGPMTCPVCKGKGKVTVLVWLLLSSPAGEKIGGFA